MKIKTIFNGEKTTTAHIKNAVEQHFNGNNKTKKQIKKQLNKIQELQNAGWFKLLIIKRINPIKFHPKIINIETDKQTLLKIRDAIKKYKKTHKNNIPLTVKKDIKQLLTNINKNIDYKTKTKHSILKK